MNEKTLKVSPLHALAVHHVHVEVLGKKDKAIFTVVRIHSRHGPKPALASGSLHF